MSLKVYTAYRVRKGKDVWDLASDLQAQATKRAQRLLRKLFVSVSRMSSADLKSLGLDGKLNDSLRYLEISRKIRAAFGAATLRSERDMFDLDVSITFRKLGSRFYLIPYSGSGFLSTNLDFLRRHPDLEEYAYWNNSDRPDAISSREWAARRRVWDALTDDAKWRDFLTLQVVSHSGWMYVCPAIDMARAHYKAHTRAAKRKPKPSLDNGAAT